MKRVNRRTFLQWLSPRPAAEPCAERAPTPPGVPASAPAPAAGCARGSTATGDIAAGSIATGSASAGSVSAASAGESQATASASGFSLEAFYAARGPQKLPPIAIRPSVLHYAGELTHVGCPPAHQPPELASDPHYTRLAAEAAATAAAPRGRR